MHGMVVIITTMMVEEQIKKKIKYLEENKTKVLRIINIAMIVVITIIAIILIDIIYKRKKISMNDVNISYTSENIKFEECKDENVIKFIEDYFKARIDLNFPKIFLSYGRDYYKEKREDKQGNIKKIEDSVRYERTFVKGYNNIVVYVTKGINEGDVVCVVTYDLMLGFTDDSAPMLMMFYLIKNDNSYVVKEDVDVGTSKYLVACANTESVKNLYNETKAKLTRGLISSESLKLAYNSLRQYEMNMNGDINYGKNKLIDNFGIIELDPIKDADEIYDYIVEAKNEEKIKKELDDYLGKVVDSINNPKIIGTESNIN